MYDPLASGFEDESTPPWPTTPHSPNSPIPNLRRASDTIAAPIPGPAPGLYGKEPQIYGQQAPGLVSPEKNVGANGEKFEKPGAYLRVRITGMDRNRRDILVRFDAQTNLPNFTGTSYRNISRSYFEFQQFYEAAIRSTPQTIVPALPLPQTSAPTDEEDDRLVKIMLQRWLTRICEDPILMHDEEVRSFVESDFGYQPTPNARRKASSGFSLIKRGVPDEDEELQRARFELTKLEGQFFEAARAIDKLSRTRKALATAHAEMGNKLLNVATTEAHPPLGNALRKIGRAWHTVSDLEQAESISECVILGDSLGYQGLNSRSAKETLLQRTGVLEEYQAAVKTTISKRRNIERLKASSNIRPERVDEALEEMEEANKYEQILAKRADGISQNLHQALDRHNRLLNDDVTAALVEHVRSSIMYERQLLRELEALRPDVMSAADKALPKANGVPRPTVVPPLEDPALKPLPPSVAASGNATPVRSPSPLRHDGLPPQSPGAGPSRPPVVPMIPSIPPTNTTSSPLAHLQNSLAQPQNSLAQPSKPLSPTASSFVPTTATAAAFTPPTISSFNPLAASTRATLSMNEPPLGGRLMDGTKSMFIKPPTSPVTQSPAPPSTSHDPLLSPSPHPLARSSSVPVDTTANVGLDPLGQARPAAFMSASVRVQPTRPRLDAREAASKLANMF